MMSFIDTFVLSFFTFFATVSPISSLILFMSLTGNYSSIRRKEIAVKAIFISSIILIGVMFLGAFILDFYGIHFYAVRTAGGLLLLITATGMIFGDDTEGYDRSKAVITKDITIFPLSVPIIAGPGAMTASMLLIQIEGFILKMAVLGALVLNLLLTLIFLLLSDKIIAKISKSVIEVFMRIAGLILASLAIQFIFDGLKESGVFK
ncbi:MarC family protein [Candidatus Hepatincolaceae symbiont of Richtersius coronifer]